MNVLDVVNLEGVVRIFLKPNIPEVLKSNALMKICPGLSPDDEILILIDDSLFGDGKAGIVITNKRFYHRDSFGEAFYLEFKDIEYFFATRLKGFFKAQATLFVNGKECYNFAMINLETANFICSELNKYIKRLYLEQYITQNSSENGANAATIVAVATAAVAGTLSAETTTESDKGFIAQSVNEFIEEQAINKAQDIVVEKITSIHNANSDEVSESEAETEEIEDDED